MGDCAKLCMRPVLCTGVPWTKVRGYTTDWRAHSFWRSRQPLLDSRYLERAEHTGRGKARFRVKFWPSAAKAVLILDW